MVSKASNKNQKQAASWFLPFVIRQQRTAVKNIIGIYLFFAFWSSPKPDIPNTHTGHPADSFKLLLQSRSQPLLVKRFTAVPLLLPPSSLILR